MVNSSEKVVNDKEAFNDKSEHNESIQHSIVAPYLQRLRNKTLTLNDNNRKLFK
jgi:hypothetical protein